MIWVIFIVAAWYVTGGFTGNGVATPDFSGAVMPPAGGYVDAAIQSGALPTGVFPTSPARFGRSPNVATGGTKIVVDLAGGAR